jgi:ABC-type glycerol-3-phosphate transport system permease component
MQGVLEAPAQRSSWLGSSRGRYKRIAVYATIVFYLFIVLLPLYWMVRSSIAENDQMYGTTIEFFPKKFTLAQFDAAINKWKFGMYLSNSVAVGLVTTILTTVMATLAAYSLVRLRFPGRAALARSVLFVYLIPGGLNRPEFDGDSIYWELASRAGAGCCL